MALSKRKRCKVYVFPAGKSYKERCEGKIKPSTPFCKEHFETHKLVEMQCMGEAHSNPYIDHCGVCMPHWGKYPVAVLKETQGTKPWEGSW